jgi:hypothetical protein
LAPLERGPGEHTRREGHANANAVTHRHKPAIRNRLPRPYPEGHERKTRTAPTSVSTSPLRKTAPYGLPAHRLGDRAGRSPGSRVHAFLRPSRVQLPGDPVGMADEGSPLTVAGAAAVLPVRPATSAFPLASPERPGEPARLLKSLPGQALESIRQFRGTQPGGTWLCHHIVLKGRHRNAATVCYVDVVDRRMGDFWRGCAIDGTFSSIIISR